MQGSVLSRAKSWNFNIAQKGNKACGCPCHGSVLHLRAGVVAQGGGKSYDSGKGGKQSGGGGKGAGGKRGKGAAPAPPPPPAPLDEGRPNKRMRYACIRVWFMFSLPPVPTCPSPGSMR